MTMVLCLQYFEQGRESRLSVYVTSVRFRLHLYLWSSGVLHPLSPRYALGPVEGPSSRVTVVFSDSTRVSPLLEMILHRSYLFPMSDSGPMLGERR